MVPRRRAGRSRPVQNLFDPDPQPFLPAFEIFQNAFTGPPRAALLAALGETFVELIVHARHAQALFLQRVERLVETGRVLGRRLQTFAVDDTLFLRAEQLLVDRLQAFLVDRKRPLVLLGLRTQPGQAMGRLGDRANLLELRPPLGFQFEPTRLDHARQRLAFCVERRQRVGASCQFDLQAPCLLEDLRATASGLALAAVDHRPLAAEADKISVQFPDATGLMAGRRLVAGRFFAVCRPLALDRAQPIVNLGKPRIQAGKDRLDLGQPTAITLELRLLLRQCPFDRRQRGRLFAVLVGTQSQPEFAKLLGSLAVFGRFHRLAADCVELRLDLVDDIGQPRDVLVDALELAFGNLKRLMPAASSKTIRRAETFACRIWSTRPCSMMQ